MMACALDSVVSHGPRVQSSFSFPQVQLHSIDVLLWYPVCTCTAMLTALVICFVAGEVHERAEAILAAESAKVPPGCLLRRVDYSFDHPNRSLFDNLKRKGYRGDKVSVWALQGIRAMELDWEVMGTLFTDISNAAAFESIIIGEMPEVSEKGVESFLASFGLIGGPIPLKTVVNHCFPQFSSEQAWWAPFLEGEEKRALSPRLFRANQRRVSIDEMEEYEAHVRAAEETGEDFLGNFS